MIYWKNHRNEDNSINLCSAYDAAFNMLEIARRDAAHEYLKKVHEIQPIVDRQVAGVALVSAYCVAKNL